ncbi:hypothetical protein AACT_1473 [Arcobacter acticola]|jgi:hypothetical protein|uniref:Uncharacterized protein n=1 Tax=Arcobacter acticola TaxID=1849015 RepID=A0A6M8EVW0_9BACT|nr:hypothetical protein AACT_1473 [Arcobacter acticola]
MEELIISKEDLVQFFETQKIVDTGRSWLMEGKVVEIIALHDIEPKFLQDVSNAKFYKLIIKGNK